jgi:hypothetical protein
MYYRPFPSVWPEIRACRRFAPPQFSTENLFLRSIYSHIHLGPSSERGEIVENWVYTGATPPAYTQFSISFPLPKEGREPKVCDLQPNGRYHDLAVRQGP